MVCLLLVCALVVNISPVRAEASSLAAFVPVLVDGLAVAGAAALGIGIYKNVSDTDFNQLCDNIVTAWKQSGVVDENGYINLYSMGSDLYGVDVNALQTAFDTVHSSGAVYATDIDFTDCLAANTLVQSISPYDSYYKAYQYYYVNQPAQVVRAYSLLDNGDGTQRIEQHILFVSDVSFYFYSKTGSYTSSAKVSSKHSNGAYYYYAGGAYTLSDSNRDEFMMRVASWIEISSIYQTDSNAAIDHLMTYLNYSYDTAYDLNVYDVASAGSTVANGYCDWASNSVSGTTEAGDAVTVYPIGSTYIDDSSLSWSQEKVQSGTVPFVIVIDQTGTGGDETEPTEPDTGDGTIVPTDPVTPSLLEKLFGGIQDKLDLTYTSIQEIPELLKEFMSDVKTGFLELPGKFAEWFTQLQTTLEQLVTGQITLADLLTGLIEPVKTAITQALTSLFAPSETFISTKVNELKEKYGYLDTFLALGTDLKLYFASLGTQPPIIYIDFGAGSGFYPMGGKTVFVDLTWYADYKGTVDTILGALIWLWLAWRVFLSIPGIISGQSGMWGAPKNDVGAGSTALTIPEWRKEGKR